MFRKILVGVDFKERYEVVFKKAVSLAQATGADLMLMNVLVPDDDDSPPPLTYYATGLEESTWTAYQERYREYEQKRLKQLEDLAKQARAAGVETEFSQTSGSPGRVICKNAKTCEADLVVVGSRRRTGLAEMLLGSVSNYVMHHVSCSVLVVHE